MINTLKLKAAIAESGMNQEQIAKMLGVSLCTFNYKLNGVSEFKVSEIKKLAELLKMENETMVKIFFCRQCRLKIYKGGVECLQEE